MNTKRRLTVKRTLTRESAESAELPAQLDKLDVAADAFLPGSAERLDAWAKEYAILGNVIERAAPSKMARALCEYFAPLGENTANPAAALRVIFTWAGVPVDSIPGDEYLEDEGQTLSQWRAQHVGLLKACIGQLKTLHRAEIVTDAELREWSEKLDEIRARIEASPKQLGPVGRPHTETTMLGDSLMSLTRAIGYGHGHGQGDKYSAKAAAKIFAGIMDGYGFAVTAKTLQTRNSAARK